MTELSDGLNQSGASDGISHSLLSGTILFCSIKLSHQIFVGLNSKYITYSKDQWEDRQYSPLKSSISAGGFVPAQYLYAFRGSDVLTPKQPVNRKVVSRTVIKFFILSSLV